MTPELSSGGKYFDFAVDGEEEVTQTTFCALSVGCSLLDPPFPGGSFFMWRPSLLPIAPVFDSVSRPELETPAKRGYRRR
jgi:hypothetical protein